MVTIRINGESHEAADTSRNLLSFIRFDAGLTGTKYGCGEGVCGACTVLVDGQPLRSCMTTVGAVAGGSLTTIEGLAVDGTLHPLQQDFIDEQAMQCGYCIPGFIMTSVALLNRVHSPDGKFRVPPIGAAEGWPAHQGQTLELVSHGRGSVSRDRFNSPEGPN